MTIKNVYVCQLPEHVRNAIRHDLVKTLHDIGYHGNELKDVATDGMNSKIIDLEDTININDYVKVWA